MRTTIQALALVTLTACSSPPELLGDSPTEDDAVAGEDSQAACGDCLSADGSTASEPSVEAAPIDGAAVDDAVETAPSDARDALEQALCATGAPRLEWRSGGCYDTGASGATLPFFCRFGTARDGRVRCLPPGSTMVGAYRSGTACAATPCLPSDPSCETGELTTWTSDPVPPYLIVDGAPARVYPGSRLGSGAWMEREGESCVTRSTLYPYFTPTEQTVYVGARVPDAMFVAAPL